MITFRELTLQDKAWMSRKIKEDDRKGCEFTFANNYIWRSVYQVEVVEVHDCCIIKYKIEGDDYFAFPIGTGDKRQAIEALIEEAKEKGTRLYLDCLLEEEKRCLEEWFGGQFVVREVREGFDYIYTVEKLTNLAGKKLHGKRNHIARFKDNWEWSYEPVTAENKLECLEMNRQWCDRQTCKWNQDMEDEFCAVQEAIEHFGELDLVGGVLRANGDVVAFTIGEPLNSDTFVVHIEKAFSEIQGAYPMINQQFVAHECQGYTYVNREEDAGVEGLRKAKLSYYPDILLEKYLAEYVG